MKVVLTRHGQTQDTQARRYSGARSNAPLCLQGRQELGAYEEYAHVKYVYTTGLLRTEETAAICYPQAQQRVVEQFQEMDFGSFEGKTWQQLRHVPAYQKWLEGECKAACPGGESREAFVKRCCTGFQQVMEAEEAGGAQEVHLVVHGGTFMALASTFAQPAMTYFEAQPVPGECWECWWDSDFLQVVSKKQRPRPC